MMNCWFNVIVQLSNDVCTENHTNLLLNTTNCNETLVYIWKTSFVLNFAFLSIVYWPPLMRSIRSKTSDPNELKAFIVSIWMSFILCTSSWELQAMSSTHVQIVQHLNTIIIIASREKKCPKLKLFSICLNPIGRPWCAIQLFRFAHCTASKQCNFRNSASPYGGGLIQIS